MQDCCLTISAAASLLCLGLVQISTARAVIYGGGSVTTFNAGGAGKGDSLSPAEGACKVFLSWESSSQCAQGSPSHMCLTSPVKQCSVPVPSERRWPLTALTSVPCSRPRGQPKRLTSPPPKRGYCFLLWFLPVAKADDVAAHLYIVARVKVKVGRVTVLGRKVLILCHGLTLGTHLCETLHPHPRLESFTFMESHQS